MIEEQGGALEIVRLLCVGKRDPNYVFGGGFGIRVGVGFG